jgi:hypothetical protein
MRRLFQLALVAGALAVAAPAAAQYTFLSPDQPPPPLRLHGWGNTVRVNVGAGFYNSDWYTCAYGWYYPTCPATSYSSYIPFVVGPQVDIHLGGPSALSLGFTIGFGTVKANYFDGTTDVSKTAKVTTYEPTADYLVRLGSFTDDTVGRFRIGGGLLIGPDSKLGFLGRIGVGGSFFNTNRFGIGLDLVLEGGSMNGYWIGGLQLLASPEFRF